LIDGSLRGPAPGSYAVSNAEEAKAAFDLLASSGADFIKVYSSLSRESYLAIADEARRLGVPFAGHVPEAVSPAEAARAGQLSQEHLLNLLLAASTEEGSLREARLRDMADPNLTASERARRLGFPEPEGLFDTYDEDKAEALFETFVDYGIWQTPTLTLLQHFAAGGEPVMRLPFMQDLAGPEKEAERAEFFGRVSRLLERHKQLVGDMHRAGVQFLAGTDSSPATPVPLGTGLHDELELLVESGLTPMEALQTATRNPAFYFGILTLLGTVETGKVADLVILNANPLEDIRNTRQIDAVVMRGVHFARPALDRMLEEAGP
jgi:imidazolonepropionase-like amidohydrolase